MGYKASMIIVQNPSVLIGDEELLTRLGFSNVSFFTDMTFDACMYPGDESLNIGYYNNCLIISEDYQLTTELEQSITPHLLSSYEKILTELFPDSEILTVACHSVVNYHMYSLVKSGQKLRFKMVTSEIPVVEYGNPMEEEEQVYAYSTFIKDRIMFRSPDKNDDVYEYAEDQLMEDFAFGVAKRHLGVMISTDEDEELMFNTLFKKYKAGKRTVKTETIERNPILKNEKKPSWLSKLFKM